MNSKLRIAWFTQEGDRSYSGRFSELMLPHIAQEFDVEVFTESFAQFESYETYHYLSAFRRHAEKPFDFHFYQVENGKSGHFIRSALGLHPGVTLFHDFLMTDFGSDPLTNSPWSAVVDKYKDPASPWPSRTQEFPRKEVFAEREAALTVSPVFTSVRSHNEYRRCSLKHLTADRSWYLPLPVADRGMVECGYSPSILHIGFCGSPRIEHRAHKVLHALHHARVPYKLFWLIDEGEERQAEELVAEFRIGSVEFIKGRTPSAWESLHKEIHVAVHTLFSAFGSTGYFLPASLMAGKAALVTRFADIENLPASVAFQVDPGESEAVQMAMVFQELHKNPGLLINREGRAYALENHEASSIAGELGWYSPHQSRASS